MVIPRTLVRCVITAAVAVAAGVGSASAQRATQVVSFRVEGIEQIAFEGAPSLVISSAAAGQPTATVRASGGVWSVTTNQVGQRITASIDQELPPGLALSVQLAAPTGAQSAGLRTLGPTPVDVITNLAPTATRELPLTYQLDAKITAGQVIAGTRTVTFTITAGM